MSEAATYTLLAFGSAADVLGWRERCMPADGRPLARLLDDFARDSAEFAAGRDRLRLAINERYVEATAIPVAGDEVALIPPVAGGDHDAPEPVDAALTRDPIDPAGLLSAVEAVAHGAGCLFVGVVRAETDPGGRTLVALEYSAYEAMAVAELRRIAGDALAAHGAGAIRVVHRLGRLAIGEASVAVAVGGGHRAETFAACRDAIERLKQDVPIFKREVWDDGGHTWVAS